MLLYFMDAAVKTLPGRRGPHETESCQSHGQKAGLRIERDGLFMLATARGLLSERCGVDIVLRPRRFGSAPR